MKAIRCRQIYTSVDEILMDGYLLIDRNRIKEIVPVEKWHSSMADEVIDYSQGFLMPGFSDYHVHMAMAAMMEHFGTIRATRDEHEAAEKNKDKDPDKWILGGAWDHFVWPGQKLPSKESLDVYFPDTPVFSMNKECHGAWLNSEALRRFGIDKYTVPPENGEYFKDEKGELTGYVHEGAVAPLLAKIFDDISDGEIADFTRSFAKMANRLGITSVGDLPLHGILREGAYRILQESGDLTIRINFSVGMMEPNEKISTMGKEFHGDIVRFNGVKDFLDGTPMGHIGYDMPGHEKFVRHMLAGIGGIDIVLLIVAADEGFMPQTKEHFEILKMLDIDKGIVVITKTDMVDEEWLEVVREDVADNTTGTFLEGAPVVEVSSRTGEGIEQLKEMILEMASGKEMTALHINCL